jgi:hypothetical protein
MQGLKKRFVIPAILVVLAVSAWFSFNYPNGGYLNSWPNNWLCQPESQPQKVVGGALSEYVFPRIVSTHVGRVQLVDGSCLFTHKMWVQATFGGVTAEDPKMVEMCQLVSLSRNQCEYTYDQNDNPHPCKGTTTLVCSGPILPPLRPGTYLVSVRLAPAFGVEIYGTATITVS